MGEGLFAPSHLLVVAVVALVLFFGWKQLPDMARSLGRSLRIFKTEIKGMSEDDKARAAAKENGEPKAIEAAPAAQVVPAPVQQVADPQVAAPQVPAQAVPAQQVPVAVPAAGAADRPRPRPTPNGATRTATKTD